MTHESPASKYAQGPNEPMALFGIMREATRGKVPVETLGELVADLAWHIAILRDRIDEAGIAQLEEG